MAELTNYTNQERTNTMQTREQQIALAYKCGFMRARRQANGGVCTQTDEDEATKRADRYAAAFYGNQVASTKAGPKGIPFGQHLTCSQCQGACTDHYSVSNNIWCPECAEGRIQPTGQHPSWLPTPQEVDQYMPPERRDYLHGKRAKLLERIQELVDQHPTYPEQSLAGLILADLRDELAAVESELGYPEAQEPEEA